MAVNDFSSQKKGGAPLERLDFRMAPQDLPRVKPLLHQAVKVSLLAVTFRRDRVVGSLVALGFVMCMCLCAGCGDDTALVREIQSRRQEQLQANSVQDHLGETFELLSDFVELNPEKASQQIAYHLNQWRSDSAAQDTTQEQSSLLSMLRTVGDVLPEEQAQQEVMRETFAQSDVSHLRDCYLFRQILRWVDQESSDDWVVAEWLSSLESNLGPQDADRIRTAVRLFDWTVRNVALEARDQGSDYQSPPTFSLGMAFQGPGYRQSDYETVWRGTGDALQRAGVFTQLCFQAEIPAAVLAIQSTESGKLTPWSVGVLVGNEVYLFEPELGSFIPGPDQTGIATLAQARKDPSVMRRLNVPGFFEYAWTQEDIQQNIALLNVMPTGLSSRMNRLQSSLTGENRMRVYLDAVQLSQQWDAASGIAGARLWDVPLLAEVYHTELQRAAERDPRIAFWYRSRWAMLEAEIESAKQLALGRWQHLRGRFSDNELDNEDGARTYYLTQRAPEFEIEDLRIDVDLQKAYGIRRELRADPELYDRQVQQIQELLRMGKRTATYWLSLVQFEDQRHETAKSWLEERVLDKAQRSFWEPAAQYNLARTMEKLGLMEEAIELYKTVGAPQEHGNRIRARLIAKSDD